MKTKEFFVIKKSSGMNIKRFMDEEKARLFAAKCKKNNPWEEYIICVWAGGYMQEI